MKRKARIFWKNFRYCWMREMEFRTDFVSWLIIDAGWTAIDVIIMVVLVTNIQLLGNWDLPKTLVVVGVFRIFSVIIWGWFWQSFKYLTRLITEGSLDFVLTKPVDSQFLVSTSRFAFNQFPSLLGGIFLVVFGLRQMSYIPSFVTVGLFLFALAASAFVIYSLYFLTMTLAVYTDRVSNLPHLFSEIYYSTGRYPREIYPPLLQRLLTSVFPFALLVAVPAETLFGSWSLSQFLSLVLAAPAFFIISRYAWLFSLRRYSSASS